MSYYGNMRWRSRVCEWIFSPRTNMLLIRLKYGAEGCYSPGDRLIFDAVTTFFPYRYKTNSMSLFYMNILLPPQCEVSHLSFPPSIHPFWWYIPQILMDALMLHLCFFSDSMITNSLCMNTTPWTPHHKHHTMNTTPWTPHHEHHTMNT